LWCGDDEVSGLQRCKILHRRKGRSHLSAATKPEIAIHKLQNIFSCCTRTSRYSQLTNMFSLSENVGKVADINNQNGASPLFMAIVSAHYLVSTDL